MSLAHPSRVRLARPRLVSLALLGALGCDPAPGVRAPFAAGPLADDPDFGSAVQALTAAERLARVTAIRDTAAGLGMTNSPLLAGIAESETHMAHCWSEATWACQGPASASCGGGPVIAGSGDGPCANQQGGLGMFQFDGGTYAQTLARDGEGILLLEGNIAKGVDFVVQRTIEEIAGADDEASALAWWNAVPLVAGDPLTERWAAMIVCRYNGCCSDASLCVERRDAYRDNAIDLFNEYGAEFWAGAACEPVPAEGRVIDENDLCYLSGGDPQYWRRRAESGYDGGLDWTMTTAAATAANVGTWRLELAAAGRYSVEVHLDGGVNGTSTAAKYVIHHAGAASEAVVDQRSATGFVSLGEFDFAAGGDQSVVLGDNTGEGGAAAAHLAYDAIRLTPADGEPGPGDGDALAGCSTSGAPGGGVLLAALLIGGDWLRRRIRRGHSPPGRGRSIRPPDRAVPGDPARS